jgi:hypothetical protein
MNFTVDDVTSKNGIPPETRKMLFDKVYAN